MSLNIFPLLFTFLFATTCFASGCSELDTHSLPTPKLEPLCEEPPPPLFTGPLLTPSGHVVPAGYINVEPYAFYTVTTGVYDSDWNSISTPDFTTFNTQLPVFVGLTEWANILVVAQSEWNETEGVSSFEYGDMIVELDFQLIHDTEHNTLPGLKFYIQEVFPTGHYDRRDPQNLTTDISGKGSFKTTFGFVITRMFNLWACNYLSLRLNGFFIAPSKVDVHGFSAYGGAPDTRACVKPGTCFGSLFGMEYNFTRHFAFACDAQVVYGNKTTFSGFPGTLPDGNPAPLGFPSSFQFSLAPALEYNFNEHLGIIGGVWFSLAGRNTTRFISGVIAINYFGPLTKVPKHRYRTSGGGTSPSGAGGGF